MLIRIISGTYGHRPKLANGEYSHYVVPVRRNDPPIDVDEAEAVRLVDRGIAVYAKKDTGAVATALSDVPEVSTSVDSSDDADGEDGNLGPGEIPGHFAESDLSGMTFAALKKLASDLGIDVAKNATKRSLITRICAEEVMVPSGTVTLNVEDVVE